MVAFQALCHPVPPTCLPSSHTGLPSGPQTSQAWPHLHFCSLFQNVPPPRERHGSLPHFLQLTSTQRAATTTLYPAVPQMHRVGGIQSPPDAWLLPKGLLLSLLMFL